MATCKHQLFRHFEKMKCAKCGQAFASTEALERSREAEAAEAKAKAAADAAAKAKAEA